MQQDNQAIALAYLDAISQKQLARLDALVAPDIRFTGPAMALTSRPALVTALERIGAVHVRSDVKRVWSDGDDVCVIYDFVTDLAGPVPTIEWIRITDGRIRSVDIYYDQVPWLKIRESLATRPSQVSA